MSADSQFFSGNFFRLTGYSPMRWQHRLFDRFMDGMVPAALDLPTGLGKTSVMAIWLLARALAKEDARKAIPRRLVYIVDRRAVVDQATAEAEKLRAALEADASHLKEQLELDGTLPISTLRGAHVDNREWLDDPAAPAIIVGTVDMIGSRLLFGGYGVSHKMRPYHAGLLGADTLVVLDEAHLVPPFQYLLAAIEDGKGLLPQDEGVVPCLRFLPLSATQRLKPDSDESRQPFRLEANDISHDDVAAQRFLASKRLYLEQAVEKDWNGALAKKAWELATKDNRHSRVVVFCNRRDKADDESSGPSVMGVLAELHALAKGNKKVGVPAIDCAYELLVGGRRVKERQDAAECLKQLGFISGGDDPNPPEKPTFLLATSAGEVGVDFDADHMVSDLAPWERMVQRLGRVNRRGGKDREAQVVVFDNSETWKNDDHKERLKKTFGLLERIGNGGQLSSASLIALRRKVGEKAIDEATTPDPSRPALTRALVDAWSMTSLEQHTGRPDVAPWLRGWVEDDKPQTDVVWRKYLPVRFNEPASQEDVEGFFEAAPPHLTEKLETETYRVVPWLMKRAEERKADQVNEDEIVAFALDPDGSLRKSYRLRVLLDKDKKIKEILDRDLSNATLVVDARFAGLKDGLLDTEESIVPRTADDDEEWLQHDGKPATGFRIRCLTEDARKIDEQWPVSFRLDLRESEDGETDLALVVEGVNEERRSESRNPQLLEEHQSWAEERARTLAEALGLPKDYTDALALAAFLHDEGKRSRRWQIAFNSPRDGIYAKTKGPFRNRLLGGYRHEFGSLPYAEAHDRFKALREEWGDLVLHLIAAHHGQARPVIGTRGCEDAPPSALEERARDVALRFARLQTRWGPWGLAWWEALLRAADQQASRDNDRGEGLALRRERR